MKSKILIITLIIAIILSGALIFFNRISKSPVPDYSKDLIIPGLSGEVEVYRDSFAIPHLYAQNERDMYLATGYLMAQDRLWQMDLLRRVTQGRLAEILSDDLLETDKLMRSLLISKKSEEIFNTADENIKTALLAFSEGINAFIAENGKKLPFEFRLLGYKPEKWEPVHSINLIGYMAWDLSTGWPNEMALFKLMNKTGPGMYTAFLPDKENPRSSVYPDFIPDQDNLEILTALHEAAVKIDDLGLDIFRGSNNWAVSGSRTKSGKPLLANDMHLGLFIPGIWYQMHQVVPGKLDVTGVVLPGQPFVIAGHNRNIAWGFTNVMTDDLDFYEETLNPANPDEYLLDGKWIPFKIVEERIINKSGDTINYLAKYTHRGPVVSDKNGVGGKTISMCWTGSYPSNEIRSVYLLNRASGWEEFREAIRTFVSVNQNIVYADVEGNIGLHSTIGLPVRGKDGFGVFPGDTSLYDWKGLVGFDELPYTFNPECGYVSSANNNTAGHEYPYYISSWFDLVYRQDRISELLKENQQVDIEYFIKIQADQKSKMAEKIMPVFLQGFREDELTSQPFPEILSMLKNWNYELSAGSVEATLFEFLYYHVFENLASDELGQELFDEIAGKKVMVKNFMENFIKGTDSEWCDDISTENITETFSDIMHASLLEAVTAIQEKLGDDPADWKWGEIHSFTIKHPISSAKLIEKIFKLDRGPYPVGGSHHTVSPYSYSYMDPGSVNHGSSHRHIYDLSDWNNSLTIIPTGTSGIPASRHYCDQIELYIKNQYHTDYVSKDKVVGNAKYLMKFLKSE